MSNTTAARTDSDPLVSAVSVNERLRQNAALRILDVRTPGEFEAGHIKGAQNIPLDQLDAYAEQLAAPGPEMILVCQAGSRAAAAQKRLSAAGAKDHRVLDGGMNSWTTSGGEVEYGEARWVLERQVRLVAGSLVLTGILVSLKWPAARFLSGLVGGGLVFAAVSNTCAMGTALGKLPYNRGRKQDIEQAVARLTS